MNAEPGCHSVTFSRPRLPGRQTPVLCLLVLQLIASGTKPLLVGAEPPKLTVRHEGATVVVSWPSNGTNFVLLQALDLHGAWSVCPATPQPVGAALEATIQISTNALFFRLRDRSAGTMPPVIGTVLEQEGRPVPNASVGGVVRTDWNGVGSGAPLVSAAGWVRIDAPGFATSYIKPAGRTNRSSIFEASLTPFLAVAERNVAAEVKLLLGEQAAAELEVALSPSAWPAGAQYAGLAKVNPYDVGPISAPLEPRQDLFLERAFAVQLLDANLVAMEGAPGNPLTVIVRDNKGTNAPPILARFDPTNGYWLVMTGACSRLEPNVLACSVSMCAPLYGLFTPTRVAAPHILGGDTSYEDYRKSRKRFDERARQLGDLIETGQTVDPSKDAELNAALDEMAASATAYAAAHPDESGKLRLGRVAEQAYRLGRDTLAESLMAQARAIAEEIAWALLNDADCGRLLEIVHAMEQVILLAGSPALEQALRDKIERLFSECDLWTGTINCHFWISSQHVGLDDFTLNSGGGCWREEHHVRMATHAKTLVLKGESLVKHSFPNVKYRNADEVCEQSISFYGQPAFASLELQWDGTFDGLEFNVGPARLASYSNPINIVQHLVMQMEDAEGTCENVRGYPLTLPFPNYSSVLVHGFLSSPPITIQEMLETAPPGPYPEGTNIRGSEEVSNAYPEPNFGRYPFTRGTVTWSLFHVTKVLPFNP